MGNRAMVYLNSGDIRGTHAQGSVFLKFQDVAIFAIFRQMHHTSRSKTLPNQGLERKIACNLSGYPLEFH
jgi:hypothetical protein